jgi:hypothetical protein
MKHVSFIALLLCAGILACGGGSTGPTPNPSPTATPTPITPTPTPTPAEIACTPPTPAPLSGWRVKIQVDQGYRKVLDSRALVGPDAAYCAAIGQGGDTCVARNENDPQAITCQNLVVGQASDSRRYGPTWYWVPPGATQRQPCRPSTEANQDPGCKNHQDNQYFVITYGPGTFSPCGANGVCGGFVVP